MNSANSTFVTVAVATITALGAIGGPVVVWMLGRIHRLVNSRMTEALERIEKLEHGLGLKPGEEVPTDG